MPDVASPLILRITVLNSVAGVWGAIQEGHGSSGRPHGLVKELGERQSWDVPISLKAGKPSGQFLQRDSKGPFVYLLWGTSAGQWGSPYTRRAKIYLPDSPEFPGECESWEVQVEGRGKDGGPACATLKPAVDWAPTG